MALKFYQFIFYLYSSLKAWKWMYLCFSICIYFTPHVATWIRFYGGWTFRTVGSDLAVDADWTHIINKYRYHEKWNCLIESKQRSPIWTKQMNNYLVRRRKSFFREILNHIHINTSWGAVWYQKITHSISKIAAV